MLSVMSTESTNSKKSDQRVNPSKATEKKNNFQPCFSQQSLDF